MAERTFSKEFFSDHTRIMSQDEAQRLLFDYIKTGRRWDEERKVVYTDDVRHLLLHAGYTELALALSFQSIQVVDGPKISSHGKTIEQPRFVVSMYSRNRYGLPIGQLDGISTIKYLRNIVPDTPSDQDLLQQTVLETLRKFSVLKNNLQRSGHRWFSLDNWQFSPFSPTSQGAIHFWLNPFPPSNEQERCKYGWYTLHELESWLKNDPNSPVLVRNKGVEEDKKPFEPYWKYFPRAMKTLVETKTKFPNDRILPRLVNIALMRCPFPEVVEEYQHHLTINHLRVL